MPTGYATDVGLEAGRLRCAACGDGPIDIEDGGSGTCPNCRESYSLFVCEEFALLEADGWVVSVTLADRETESADAVNV